MLFRSDPSQSLDIETFCPSTDGRQGASIIEASWIGLERPSTGQTTPVWRAIANFMGQSKDSSHRVVSMYGETALIAAMRCKVATVYGEAIDMDDALRPEGLDEPAIDVLSHTELEHLMFQQFPRTATSWSQATQEVMDMCRASRVLAGVPENHALDFRSFSTPAEHNTKGIAGTIKFYQMLNHAKQAEFCNRFGLWLTTWPQRAAA